MSSRWFIEGYIYQRERLHRVAIESSPFVIGRSAEAALAIRHEGISRSHCILDIRGDTLWVSDNGSTNGTRVNHDLIARPRELLHGDVIRLASTELRVIEVRDTVEADDDATTFAALDALEERLPSGIRELDELLAQSQVRTEFQAIFSTRGELMAHEALGRGAHLNLAESPWKLFQIAESVDKEVALSELFRVQAVRDARRRNANHPLFLNTHPSELRDIERLLCSLEELRAVEPDLHMVLEVHEDGVSDLGKLREVKAFLAGKKMDFAYDDFGAGQSRLLELIEVPPSVVKFDISLIRGIDTAPKIKRDMIESLVRLVANIGVRALAEGVETEAELAVCEALGFELIQGYLMGRPTADLQTQPSTAAG